MAAEPSVKPLRVLTWTDGASADWALVQQCAAGDEDACTRLVSDHQRMVHQLAFHLLGDAQEALDLEIQRYRAGTDSYLNVITTQIIALQDQQNAITILQKRMLAAVDLVKAAGGGWDASALPSEKDLRPPTPRFITPVKTDGSSKN